MNLSRTKPEPCLEDRQAWAGSCRQLVLGFAEGSFQRANLKVK